MAMAACVIDDTEKESSKSNDFNHFKEEVDLIAFLTLDETRESSDEANHRMEIEDLVYSEKEEVDDTIELHLNKSDGLIHEGDTYLIFATEAEGVYSLANENSLIIGINDIYDVRMPDIGSRYTREGFIQEMERLDEPFLVKLEFSSGSEGTVLDHFPENIMIDEEGNIKVYTETMYTSSGMVDLEVGQDAPVIEKKIPSEEVTAIKKAMKKNKFQSLPRDITDYGVEDGSGSSITLYQDGEVKRVGGYNSNNEQYDAIKDLIFAHVKDDYNDWLEETKVYLKELNDL